MAIDEAREVLAAAMGCLPGEVIFTSSGTEAMVTAVLGIARSADGERNKVVISGAEHECALRCREPLEDMGFEVTIAPVDAGGAVVPDTLCIDERTLLVAAMHANNETGAISDAEAISQRCKEFGAVLVCDAVQTLGRLPLPDADLLAVSAHKLYGPKGVGALRIRAGVKLKPLMVGGGQEREMRSGTENVAAIVGFAEAVRRYQPSDADRLARDAFVAEVRNLLPRAVFSALDQPCLPGHAHVRIPGVPAAVALINLDRAGVAASSGAACSSGSVEPSHVLLATGLPEAEAAEGLRFSFGRDSSVEEAIEAARLLAKAVP